MPARRHSPTLERLLSGQQSLFHTPRPAPAFDDLCPAPRSEQLELEVDAAIRARNQTTIDDFAAPDDRT